MAFPSTVGLVVHDMKVDILHKRIDFRNRSQIPRWGNYKMILKTRIWVSYSTDTGCRTRQLS